MWSNEVGSHYLIKEEKEKDKREREMKQFLFVADIDLAIKCS